MNQEDEEGVTIEDLWDSILVAGESLRLQVENPEEILRIKKSLSAYKAERFRDDPELKELVGEAKLAYKVDDLLLTISLETPTPKKVKARLLP